MIGSDIIDLAFTKKTTNWQRPRFLDKTFGEAEQNSINQSQNPFLMVWQLWGMKESAYKSYLQKGGSAFNNPRRIEIKLSDRSSGSAQIGSFKSPLLTETTADYIHAFTLPSSSIGQVNEVFKINSKQAENASTQVYQRFRKHIALDWNLEEGALSIKKDLARIPHLYLHGQRLDIAFSLSHHGQFAAYSFLKA